MPIQIYNWKRFWCPRTATINLGDSGYLADPESEFGQMYNPDLVPFESLDRTPCLALLGEPGIGKTHVMQAEREAINTRIEKEGGQPFWLDLRSYGSEDRLVQKLFGNTVFSSWAKNKHRLYLFLDSLDECLLRINVLASLLIDELKKYPVERLYLRIACRTADWPNSLEDGLVELWGEKAVEVYELAPLRRVDVVEAAKASGLAHEAFVREIDRMGVVPLAIKPVTLDFLLRGYSQDGQLPSTQVELYREGCRLLCEETNESRRDAQLTGSLTAGQRMAVAARIAAVTVLANKYAIWTGVDRGDVSVEDTTVEELCGGSESIDSRRFEVTEIAIKETVSTGLFSSRGPNRMGWAHHTYAQFLAALYLVQHKVTLKQIMSLVVHPGDPDGKIVPQLYEPTTWLAGMEPAICREVIRLDPEVLVRSDIEIADEKNRAALVETLLRLYDKEELLYHGLGFRSHYRKLAHRELSQQLRTYICDGTRNIVVRGVAIDIAEACEARTLQGEFADIALNPCEPLQIRVNAGYAIVRIGDDTTRARLKPLATGEAGDDPDDELKGCGLQAVWPKHLTIEELFVVMTPPKRENLIGSYRMFLLENPLHHLQPSDLPAALRWVEKQGPHWKLRNPFGEFADTIMLKAWEHLGMPGVLGSFAKTVLSRLRQDDDKIVAGEHASEFRDALIKNDEKRRRVVEAMFPLLLDPEKDSIRVVYSQTPLVTSKDIPWMIEQLRTTTSKKDEKMWAQLIARGFNWRERDQSNVLLSACEDIPILREKFAWLLEPVELGSSRAKKMKEDYLEMQKWQEPAQDPTPLEPPPAKRIVILLERFESGDIGAWWQLNLAMTLERDSTHYGDELQPDLMSLPGWKVADGRTRARIVQGAKTYVLEQDPDTSKWLGINIPHRPACAGYRALRLLLQEDPDFLSTVPHKVWKKWAPIFVTYPESPGTGAKKLDYELLKLAYNEVPDDIIRTLMVIIDKENKEHSHIFITRKLECCWDDRLGNALLMKAKDKELKPECMGCLLSDLIDHKVDGARAFAESLVPLPLPRSGEARSKAIVAARVLMIHAEDAGWSVVWPAVRQDAEFGQDVISAVAERPDRQAATIGQRLTENQLADLYIWLIDQYPPAEDPKFDDGGHFLGPRDHVATLRDSILRYLQQQGTNKACEAIRRIAGELPELKWLKRTLLEAKNTMLGHTWVPLQPGDILKMASDKEIPFEKQSVKGADEEVFELRPNIYGIGFNLKALAKKWRKYIEQHRK